MFDLLARAERRANKALVVFERATTDLRTANDHLDTVKAKATARVVAVRAKAEAEVERILAAAEGLVEHHEGRAAKADEAKATNSRILAKIEGLLS